mmetsp:Transcript_26738/g.52500  ORF Transcript_26738/g.52500 Transcript_26738/m.52500 type:complete len:102 (-) Transcript_26738:620-925(-)
MEEKQERTEKGGELHTVADTSVVWPGGGETGLSQSGGSKVNVGSQDVAIPGTVLPAVILVTAGLGQDTPQLPPTTLRCLLALSFLIHPCSSVLACVQCISV